MKRNLIAFLIIICSFGLLSACSSSDQKTVKDSKGNTISLSQYKGKWVVINYWATWCKPCLTEMPALNKLYDQNKNNVVVLGVSFDGLTNEEINSAATQHKIDYPMLSSFPIASIGVKNVSVLPTTYIINPQGKLVKTLKGPQTEQQFAAAIGISDSHNG